MIRFEEPENKVQGDHPNENEAESAAANGISGVCSKYNLSLRQSLSNLRRLSERVADQLTAETRDFGIFAYSALGPSATMAKVR